MPITIFKIPAKIPAKKSAKKIWTDVCKNCNGFATVFLLTVLPALLGLLMLIYNVVFLVELKNEFRYKCINESLALQKEFSENNAEILIHSAEILERLKKIISPIKYTVTLSDYPGSEPQSDNKVSSVLAYELNYTWLLGSVTNFYLKCGVNKLKKDNGWHYEIIYSTSAVKF